MIAVSGLTMRFGRTEALSNVSFDVPENDIFGFIGPNGAGKTTAMRIMVGLLAPTAGTVVLDGVDVGTDPARVHRLVGYMPDFFGVYDHLTVEEYLAFYAACYRMPAARVHAVVTDLLELIGFEGRRNDPVNILSRGMKQRLCLARTLVHDPPVLVLDEPASGLDPGARHDMRLLLRSLRERGKTIVISSHILPELADICTRFGVLAEGRMLATGSLEELTAMFGSRRAHVRIGGPPQTYIAIAEGLAAVQTAAVEGDGIVITYKGGDSEASRILADLVREGVPVVAFSPDDNGLEDAFLRLTSAAGTPE